MSATALRVRDVAENGTLECLERLIGFDTVSHCPNLPLIDWVEDYLAGHGVKAVRIPNADGTKANLVAVIGPADRPGLVLSGHTDVVPVEGQDWTSDPFRTAARDGRIYGRGACDMKGFLACVLAAVPRLSAAKLSRPAILAFSYDEELGCLGAPDLVAALPDFAAPALGCIVGEPTSMKVVRGHKTKRSLRAHVTGKALHSSLAPHGVNAVEYGAMLVAHIRHMADELRVGPHDSAYEIGHSTAHVGVMHGGAKLNIVPAACTIDFEFRALPDQDADALVERVRSFVRDTIEPLMTSVDADTGIEIELTAAYPGLDTNEDADIVRLAEGWSGTKGSSKVAFGTEGGLFARSGTPTAIIGPGSIQQAHKPDEFVEIEQLEACDRFLDRVTNWLEDC